jgi:general secretion pathway protein F
VADFNYIAIDTRGAEKRGHVAAPDLDAARVSLGRQKLYVVKIEPGSGAPARGKPLVTGLSFRRNKMSVKDLTLFTRQLATLNQVSPLEESLRTITRQTEQERVRAIVATVHAGVMEGRRLAEAMVPTESTICSTFAFSAIAVR